MDRIAFALVVTCVSLVACHVAPAVDAGRTREPPMNVLVIVGDDHATQAFGAYGAERATTPHLDELARQSVRLSRAYANNPVCTPSRQSMLTGLLPHRAGVTLLESALSESTLSLADHLGAHGYRTAIIGKTHFNSASKHGFDLAADTGEYRKHLKLHPPKAVPPQQKVRGPWRPFKDPPRVWLNADALPEDKFEDDTQSAFLVNTTLGFIDEAHARKQPFLVWLAFHEPHSPYNFPVEYAGRVDPGQMRVPDVLPQDFGQVPLVFKDLSDNDKRGIVAAYHTSVMFMDAMIGRALAGLRARGLDKNTLVIYVSDHGYHLGQHGRFEKHSFYENSVRTPFLLRAPGMAHGQTNRALVELIDLFPTISDYAGVPLPPLMHGLSVRPLVEGHTSALRPFAFSTYQQNEEAMVLTDEWKFVYQRGQVMRSDGYEDSNPTPGRQRILYNVANDPDEVHNVAEQNPAVVKQMEDTMVKRFAATWPNDLPVSASASAEDMLDVYVQAPERLRATESRLRSN
ncbi:MAG: sulfatase-like hydrolase/transferase [Deltaproteobacteria bacterium]|nr:sulfatase-like hydrolase/transferase [Deltaproteobacteria bacterium]